MAALSFIYSMTVFSALNFVLFLKFSLLFRKKPFFFIGLCGIFKNRSFSSAFLDSNHDVM